MERNSAFHPLDLMVFIVKCDAEFVNESSTKNYVVTKIHGVKNNSRVFINNNFLIEFREPDVFKSHKCCGCRCSFKQNDL